MTRRTFTDAFVDESVRGQRYLMSCVLAEAVHLPAIQQVLRRLVLHDSRIHFNNESSARRKVILEAIATCPVSVFVVVCHRRHGIGEHEARERCLTHIVERLQERGVTRLKVESRQDDSDDVRTLRRARRPEPPLVWEHIAGRAEPMLWIADGVVWAVANGGRWQGVIEPVLAEVAHLRP